MKYILLIYGDEMTWNSIKDSASQQDAERIYAAHNAYGDKMAKAGVIRGGAELKPTSTATSIRFNNSKPTTTDGPFAETKEQLGGYYLVEAADRAAAAAIAAKIPGARFGSIEVRPIMTFGS